MSKTANQNTNQDYKKSEAAYCAMVNRKSQAAQEWSNTSWFVKLPCYLAVGLFSIIAYLDY